MVVFCERSDDFVFYFEDEILLISSLSVLNVEWLGKCIPFSGKTVMNIIIDNITGRLAYPKTHALGRIPVDRAR